MSNPGCILSHTFIWLINQSNTQNKNSPVEIIKSRTKTNRMWQGGVFLILVSQSKPWLGLLPWWFHPSSPAPADGGPGSVWRLPPAPGPGHIWVIPPKLPTSSKHLSNICCFIYMSFRVEQTVGFQKKRTYACETLWRAKSFWKPPKNGSTSELFVVVLTGKSSDVCLCIFTMSTHLAKIRALPILQAVHFATGSSGSFLHVLLIAVSESLQPISPANQSGWISEEWGDAPHRSLCMSEERPIF